MGRFESRIKIHRPLKAVFDIYTQPDTFRWADVRSVTWVHGNLGNSKAGCTSRQTTPSE